MATQLKRLARRAIALGTLGRIRYGTGCARACHLTFDDGPHPVHTRELLNLLELHGARATFFIVGENVERNPKVAEEIVRRGHELGNHSYRHQQFWRRPLADQLAEIEATDRLLQAVDGRNAHAFRPPQGRLPARLAVALLLRGTRIVMWTRDSEDYRLEADAIVERLSRQIPAPGDVLLFHDDGPRAARALEVMLPRWSTAGLRFDPIPV
jgi:peptidoglycan/xylan/chitin deacetylase (PgdA/CDA1 family)